MLKHYTMEQMNNRRRGGTIESEEVVYGAATVEIENARYIGVNSLKSRELEAGQIIAILIDGWPFQVYEFLGFVEEEDEETVKWNTPKEMFKAKGVRGLRELEEKEDWNNRTYMKVKDLETGESGAWLYIFSGKWSMGSGANSARFWLMEEYDQDKFEHEQKVKKAEKKCSSLEKDLSRLEQRIEELKLQLEEKQDEYERAQVELYELTK